jgi:hypothetical protein
LGRAAKVDRRIHRSYRNDENSNDRNGNDSAIQPTGFSGLTLINLAINIY